MNSVYEFKSLSAADTIRLGEAIAETISDGGVIALNGDLGAGKTTLTRSICGGLGVDVDNVNSPTFVLMQLYQGRSTAVAHFDTYRLADPEEFLAVGGEDYLLSDQFICIVEWAERIECLLPPDHLQITIRHTGEQARSFQLRGEGQSACQTVSSIRERLID